MNEIQCIVECKVIYKDGTIEIKRPTFSQIAVGVAKVNYNSVIKYLMDGLSDVDKIEIIDVLYFKSKEDYLKYSKFL